MTHDPPPPAMPPVGTRVTVASKPALLVAGGWAGRSGIAAAHETSEMPHLVEVLFDHGDRVLMLPRWLVWASE